MNWINELHLFYFMQKFTELDAEELQHSGLCKYTQRSSIASIIIILQEKV